MYTNKVEVGIFLWRATSVRYAGGYISFSPNNHGRIFRIDFLAQGNLFDVLTTVYSRYLSPHFGKCSQFIPY